MIWTLALGCHFAEILEAPYILSTGLGEVHSIAPTGRKTFLAATSTGLWEVDGEGDKHQLSQTPVRQVSAHANAIYVATMDKLVTGSMPAPQGRFEPAWEVALTEPLVDLRAWCGGMVLLAYSDRIMLFDPEARREHIVALGLDRVRGVALRSAPDCAAAFVLTHDALWSLENGVPTQLAEGLDGARTVATDAMGRAWVVAGTNKPRLLRVEDGKAEVHARFLGDTTSLFFGNGGLFSPKNAYLATRDGTMDYVHVPDIVTP